MTVVRVGDLSIHYREAASPSPVGDHTMLFLHGAGGSEDEWRFQLRHPRQGWHALAVDLPGHGQSEGAGYRTIDAYRDFVRDLLDARGLGRTVLVGHSMGGAIAQSFALTYPDRVEALALVATGARLRVHPDVLAALRRGEVGEAGTIISQWAYAAGAMPATRAQSAEAFAKNTTATLEGDFLACNAFDVMQRVASIRAPTLVICGDEDRMTPVKFARFLHEAIPGARLAIIPGAGHMVMLEKPADVNRALTEFLSALEPHKPGR